VPNGAAPASLAEQTIKPKAKTQIADIPPRRIFDLVIFIFLPFQKWFKLKFPHRRRQ
jgi:hypothetical protein